MSTLPTPQIEYGTFIFTLPTNILTYSTYLCYLLTEISRRETYTVGGSGVVAGTR